MSRVRVRIAALSVALASLCGASAAAGQDVKVGGDVTITIDGLIGATFFVQDALFGLGNGQKAEFVTREFDDDPWWHGGDVRNTRLRLGFAGPELFGSWRANATFETDFFALFPGSGAFSDEQPVPRLRLAYADLTNGRTTVRFGQDWALTLGNIPVSTSHIGFPLGWGPGGFIGWRFVGGQVHHRLSSDDAGVSTVLKLGVFHNSWTGEPPDADGPSAGEASIPQLEARLDFSGKAGRGDWGAYLVGHYDRKDLTGPGVDDDDVAFDDDLTSWVAEAGARLARGRLTLHGNAYYGQAMGHHFAHIVQLPDAEITGWGGWVQAGWNLTDTWSLWGFIGTDDPDEDDDDLRERGLELDRTQAWLAVPMLRYKRGPYALGLEWLHSETDWRPGALDIFEEERTGNQFSLSVVYSF